MENIPVSFEWKGQQYKGYLSKVAGSGTSASFHLMIEGYYRGQLLLTDNCGWQFSNNKNEFTDLAEDFGDVVTAWYQ